MPSHSTIANDPSTAPTLSKQRWTFISSSHAFWGATLAVIGLLAFIYRESLVYMIQQWISDENYGHGLFVPLIAGYLIWRQRHQFRTAPSSGHLWGIVCILFGGLLYVLGELGTVYSLLHLSLWLLGLGLVISASGVARARTIWFPFMYLLTMIPLPHFLYQGLSNQLQLFSSALGIGCLQFIGVTAFREGNIIDLGPIQLQVVEACSGLRYLFPLTSLALLCAYIFQDRLWKRVVLVLSSIPISILLNGFRIGMVGVLVEVYGPGAGEGFLHLFEGWILFLASIGILWIEVVLLSRFTGPIAPHTESGMSTTPNNLTLSWPRAPDHSQPAAITSVYFVSVGLVLVLATGTSRIVHRDEQIPSRLSFVDFPMQVERWNGTPFFLEKTYIDVLRFDDYLLADYSAAPLTPVNLYVTYYKSQRKGQSAHSPQTCIPGGGWEIASLEQRYMRGNNHVSEAFPINRAVIRKGDEIQVVYYWFKQRDHILTSEYFVKAYLVWDAVTRQRTDGALIRLTTPVQAGESESMADARMAQFATTIAPLLNDYVPN